MFDQDSSSVVRSLIGLFTFRSNPVSKVYQHRNGGILEVAWSTGSLRKNTAAGELTPDLFSELANGTGPNQIEHAPNGRDGELFSYPSIKTCVFGAQKNRLIETVLLSTHNICFG